MNTIVINDLCEDSTDVHELTRNEMRGVKGGEKPNIDIGGYDTARSIVDEITKPIDVGSAIRNGHW